MRQSCDNNANIHKDVYIALLAFQKAKMKAHTQPSVRGASIHKHTPIYP